MKYERFLIAIATLILVVTSTALAQQDPGWPRRNVQPGGILVSYQPQVDDWKDVTTITWRQAFQLTPTGGKQVVGGATLTGTTTVDHDKHMVTIYGIQITNTYFPDLDPATSATMDQLLKTFVPPVVDISLERVVAYVPKPQTVNTVNLKNDPPYIFVSYTPAVLLAVDGQPVLADVPDSKLKFVVNTQWPLFFHTKESQYYLVVSERWFTAADLHGPWTVVTKLPKDVEQLPKDPQWRTLYSVIPPPANASGPIPKILYSTVPSEVILFDGRPTYAPIQGTQLVYANNTDSRVFVYSPTQTYYYLAAGRWFSAPSLTGPWTFASQSLPVDFAHIPHSSPASAILASVPGTEEAKDAVLIAQIPTVMEIEPVSAAAQVNVSYTGNPQFAQIQGTSMQYATNTVDKVIQVGDLYYLCLQGVWFMSASPSGPWTTASSVPQAIYTIPPTSPVYNVTYVTQVTTSSGTVQSSYTAGYLGAFVMGAAVGAVICSGTGYYYPPYIGYPAYGYPIYHPYATPYGAMPYYNTATGAYGYSQTAYGPYGSATHAASYNPYTGTYKTGSSVSTPYGTQKTGQAYNPYTGTYGATHQGSSPTAQWGQSYVQHGNQAAYTQHYSTSQGTVASAQGSQGDKAYGSSTAYGNTVAGKTSSGDMYAAHDGNVYQNTGSGWQKYNNSTGSWSNVNTQGAQQEAQQRTPGTSTQSSSATAQQREQSYNQERSSGSMSSENLNSEMENRQRGESQSQNWSRSGGSSGGYGGGGRSWGGGGGSYGGGGRSYGGGRR